ncbi:MAG: DUF2178 domain-containing protein [Candidatus Paceibacterota bacterium]|jgi:uncharacterized membrane protein
MTQKRFLIYRIIAVIIVSLVVSVSINYGNWYLPVIVIAASWAFLYTMSKKIEEVIADERDRMIAGKASGLAMRIYVLVSVIVGIIAYTTGRDNEMLFSTGTTLLYSACFLMFLYAILFKIFERKSHD